MNKPLTTITKRTNNMGNLASTVSNKSEKSHQDNGWHLHGDGTKSRDLFGAMVYARPAPLPVGHSLSRNDGGRVAFLIQDDGEVYADTLLLVLSEEERLDKKRAWAEISSNVETNRAAVQRESRAARQRELQQRNCATNRSSSNRAETNRSSSSRVATNRKSNGNGSTEPSGVGVGNGNAEPSRKSNGSAEPSGVGIGKGNGYAETSRKSNGSAEMSGIGAGNGNGYAETSRKSNWNRSAETSGIGLDGNGNTERSRKSNEGRAETKTSGVGADGNGNAETSRKNNKGQGRAKTSGSNNSPVATQKRTASSNGSTVVSRKRKVQNRLPCDLRRNVAGDRALEERLRCQQEERLCRRHKTKRKAASLSSESGRPKKRCKFAASYSSSNGSTVVTRNQKVHRLPCDLRRNVAGDRALEERLRCQQEERLRSQHNPKRKAESLSLEPKKRCKTFPESHSSSNGSTVVSRKQKVHRLPCDLRRNVAGDRALEERLRCQQEERLRSQHVRHLQAFLRGFLVRRGLSIIKNSIINNSNDDSDASFVDGGDMWDPDNTDTDLELDAVHLLQAFARGFLARRGLNTGGIIGGGGGGSGGIVGGGSGGSDGCGGIVGGGGGGGSDGGGDGGSGIVGGGGAGDGIVVGGGIGGGGGGGGIVGGGGGDGIVGGGGSDGGGDGGGGIVGGGGGGGIVGGGGGDGIVGGDSGGGDGGGGIVGGEQRRGPRRSPRLATVRRVNYAATPTRLRRSRRIAAMPAVSYRGMQ